MPEVKESDKWKTPGWFMAIMNQALIDRCPPNHIDDSLQTTWVEASYVNPPYSNPLPFVLKGLEEHKKNRIAVVFLLKCDSSTRWYKALVEGGGISYSSQRGCIIQRRSQLPFQVCYVY